MPCGRRATKSSRLAARSASSHALGGRGTPPSATFAATLSLNSTTSWLTSANWRRSAATFQSRSGAAVEQHAAGGRLDEARQQVDERRLAGARRPDQRDRSRRPAARGRRRRAPASGRSGSAASTPRSSTRAARAPGVEAAAALDRRVLDQRDAALERDQAARDRPGDFGQVLDRRDQHQHRGDEGDEAADRGAAACCSARAR